MTTRATRHAAVLLLALLAVPALASCAAQSPEPEPTTPTASQTTRPSYTVSAAPVPKSSDFGYWAAVEQGYFEEEGVTVETTELETRVLARDAVVSGSVDVSHVSINTSLPAFAAGEAVIAVASVFPSWPLVPVVSDTYLASKGVDPDEVAELDLAERYELLEGASIGLLSAGDIFDQTLRAQLDALGVIDPDSFASFQYLGSTAAAQSNFETGNIDAYFGFVAEAEWVGTKYDGTVLATVDDLEETIPDTLIPAGVFLVNTDWLQSGDNGDALRAFLRAWEKGNEWVAALSDEEFGDWILQDQTELVDDDAKERLLLNAFANRETYTTDGRLSDEQIERGISFAISSGVISESIDPDVIRDWGYLPDSGN